MILLRKNIPNYCDNISIKGLRWVAGIGYYSHYETFNKSKIWSSCHD